MNYKDKIIPLLKKHGFNKVVYEGPIRMLGYSQIMFYDAEFFEPKGPHGLSPREFTKSKIKMDMEKVIDIFRQHRIKHGTVVHVEF